MPPKTCTAPSTTVEHICSTVPTVPAISSGWAQYQVTPLRASSTLQCMSASRCFTPWNEPIGRSNWRRILAYSTASCSARSATPTVSASVSTARSSATGTGSSGVADVVARGRVGHQVSSSPTGGRSTARSPSRTRSRCRRTARAWRRTPGPGSRARRPARVGRPATGARRGSAATAGRSSARPHASATTVRSYQPMSPVPPGRSASASDVQPPAASADHSPAGCQRCAPVWPAVTPATTSDSPATASAATGDGRFWSTVTATALPAEAPAPARR